MMSTEAGLSTPTKSGEQLYRDQVKVEVMAEVKAEVAAEVKARRWRRSMGSMTKHGIRMASHGARGRRGAGASGSSSSGTISVVGFLMSI